VVIIFAEVTVVNRIYYGYHGCCGYCYDYHVIMVTVDCFIDYGSVTTSSASG
jgi:hypothetical protein